LRTICQNWPQTLILLISASQVGRCEPPVTSFMKCFLPWPLINDYSLISEYNAVILWRTKVVSTGNAPFRWEKRGIVSCTQRVLTPYIGILGPSDVRLWFFLFFVFCGGGN
jgi:hypothetical protein